MGSREKRVPCSAGVKTLLSQHWGGGRCSQASLPSLSISLTFPPLLLCGVFTVRDHSTRPGFGLSGSFGLGGGFGLGGFCCLAKGKPSADVTGNCSLRQNAGHLQELSFLSKI